jgi:hypothetical protein
MFIVLPYETNCSYVILLVSKIDNPSVHHLNKSHSTVELQKPLECFSSVRCSPPNRSFSLL